MMNPAPFYQMPGDEMPAAEAFFVKTDDGVQLRLACWRARGPARGTVLLFPGRTEYIEKYSAVAARLNAAGLSVLAIDWRGQGLSDRLQENGMVGHVLEFSDYQRDVVEVIVAASDMDLPRPWHLLGHSMGGCIGLAALYNELPVERAAFSAPMWDIDLHGLPRAVALGLAKGANLLGFGGRSAIGTGGDTTYVLNRGFGDNLFTHDALEWSRLVQEADMWPELTIGGASYNWIGEGLRECARLAELPSPDCPVLIGLGDREAVVSSSAIRDRADRWDNATLLELSPCRHEPLIESPEVRDRLITAMLTHFGCD